MQEDVLHSLTVILSHCVSLLVLICFDNSQVGCNIWVVDLGPRSGQYCAGESVGNANGFWGTISVPLWRQQNEFCFQISLHFTLLMTPWWGSLPVSYSSVTQHLPVRNLSFQLLCRRLNRYQLADIRGNVAPQWPMFLSKLDKWPDNVIKDNNYVNRCACSLWLENWLATT